MSPVVGSTLYEGSAISIQWTHNNLDSAMAKAIIFTREDGRTEFRGYIAGETQTGLLNFGIQRTMVSPLYESFFKGHIINAVFVVAPTASLNATLPSVDWGAIVFRQDIVLNWRVE